jgi:hypothetical protein
MTTASNPHLKAMEKAADLGGAKLVLGRIADQYIVRGSRGDLYAIWTDRFGQDYTCSCPAGQNGLYCYHLAAVEIAEHSGAPIAELHLCFFDNDCPNVATVGQVCEQHAADFADEREWASRQAALAVAA